MQVHLGAVRAFKGYGHFLAVESEGPLLCFGVPEDSSLDHKGVVVEPAPFDGVDAIGCRRAHSKQPVEADRSGERGGGPVEPLRTDCIFPRRIRVGKVQ